MCLLAAVALSSLVFTADPKGEVHLTSIKVKNDVVVWDRIVRRKEDAVINVVGKNKYMLRDLETTFKNVPPAHYALKYNVMPYVGALTYGEAGRTIEPVAFPLSQSRVS
ncbi:hypothetical protein H0H87_003019 [Tephrocybe sp. NHM501043]|nr:hypothetical protein H0H87_003019 [Tephrocybe sp. NHM501043]